MRFLRSFHESFHCAVDYYDAIDKNLARRFIDAVDQAQHDIERFQKLGRPIGKFRLLSLKGFPYRFCYQADFEGELVAVVLFHHKQREPHVLRSGK